MPGDRLRIFFASDIHGSDLCFRKFVNAAEFYKSDVIILGGDITSKFIVPVYDLGGHYRFKIGGRGETVLDSSQLESGLQRIRDSGSYPYITTREQWEDIVQDDSKMEKVFEELAVQSVKKWIRLAGARLKDKKVKCFIMSGNDDIYPIDKVIESSDVVVNPNEKVVELSGGVQMLSLGYSNPTPWRCPRDISEGELEIKIDKLMGEVDKDSQLVYCIHVPPYGSGIDSAPELDENMKPRVGPGGQLVLAPVGSKIVRNRIEVHQPLLSLHGHVHEARGFAKIGRTVCFNPGSEYHEGILRGVLIQVENGKIKDFVFTSG